MLLINNSLTDHSLIFELKLGTTNLYYFFSGNKKSKDIKEIQKEIRNIIRQVTASVAFLPLLDTACKYRVCP